MDTTSRDNTTMDQEGVQNQLCFTALCKSGIQPGEALLLVLGIEEICRRDYLDKEQSARARTSQVLQQRMNKETDPRTKKALKSVLELDRFIIIGALNYYLHRMYRELK